MIKLLHMTSNFVVWCKIDCHVEQFWSTWQAKFCSTDNVCSVWDNYDVWQQQTLCKIQHTGCFFNWYPPKKLKYRKPRLGESTLTLIGLDTPNIALINLFVLRIFRGVPVKKTPCISNQGWGQSICGDGDGAQVAKFCARFCGQASIYFLSPRWRHLMAQHRISATQEWIDANLSKINRKFALQCKGRLCSQKWMNFWRGKYSECPPSHPPFGKICCNFFVNLIRVLICNLFVNLIRVLILLAEHTFVHRTPLFCISGNVWLCIVSKLLYFRVHVLCIFVFGASQYRQYLAVV